MRCIRLCPASTAAAWLSGCNTALCVHLGFVCIQYGALGGLDDVSCKSSARSALCAFSVLCSRSVAVQGAAQAAASMKPVNVLQLCYLYFRGSSHIAACLGVRRTVVGIVCKDGVVLVRRPHSMYGVTVSALNKSIAKAQNTGCANYFKNVCSVQPTHLFCCRGQMHGGACCACSAGTSSIGAQSLVPIPLQRRAWRSLSSRRCWSRAPTGGHTQWTGMRAW